MLPDRATMYIAGAGPGALDLEFWRDVYGFSYRCLQMLHNVGGPGLFRLGRPCLRCNDESQYMSQCLCIFYFSGKANVELLQWCLAGASTQTAESYRPCSDSAR